MATPERAITGSITLPVFDYITLSVQVPNDLDYIMALNGAIYALGKPDVWQQLNETDNTPEEAAKIFRDVLHNLRLAEPPVMTNPEKIGSIQIGIFASTPEGWLLMDGSTHQQAQYPKLMAVYPAFLKNDGAGTFTVPNMRDKFPIGASGNKPRGTPGGSDLATLTVANLPEHTHEYLRTIAGVTGAAGTDAFSLDALEVSDTIATGQGAPFSVLNPYVAFNFYVVAQ